MAGATVSTFKFKIFHLPPKFSTKRAELNCFLAGTCHHNKKNATDALSHMPRKNPQKSLYSQTTPTL